MEFKEAVDILGTFDVFVTVYNVLNKKGTILKIFLALKFSSVSFAMLLP